ncbi:MAG: AtpZ/AtpI family protein [Lachnospiraceae bacterium]|nr:AtpZ/AtpI family protein [Lachnospiraceae bacterium]
MKKKDNREVMQSFALVLQFGINMIVPIMMCTLFGVWFGGKYHMEWIVIPLFFMGALAGFTNIFKMTKKFRKNKNAKRNTDVKKN